MTHQCTGGGGSRSHPPTSVETRGWNVTSLLCAVTLSIAQVELSDTFAAAASETVGVCVAGQRASHVGSRRGRERRRLMSTSAQPTLSVRRLSPRARLALWRHPGPSLMALPPRQRSACLVPSVKR